MYSTKVSLACGGLRCNGVYPGNGGHGNGQGAISLWAGAKAAHTRGIIVPQALSIRRVWIASKVPTLAVGTEDDECGYAPRRSGRRPARISLAYRALSPHPGRESCPQRMETPQPWKHPSLPKRGVLPLPCIYCCVATQLDLGGEVVRRSGRIPSASEEGPTLSRLASWTVYWHMLRRQPGGFGPSKQQPEYSGWRSMTMRLWAWAFSCHRT